MLAPLRSSLRAAVWTACVGLVACSGSNNAAPSETLPTSDLTPWFLVSSTADGLVVEAAFPDPKGYATLAPTDKLIAELADARAELVAKPSEDGPSYGARLAAPSQDTTLRIDLQRGAPPVSTRDSTITVPGAFEIIEAPTTMAEGEELTFRLSRELESPELGISGDCLAPSFSTTLVRQEGAVATFKLDFSYRGDERQCEVELRIRTSKNGTVDRAFAQQGKQDGVTVDASFRATTSRSTKAQLVVR